MLALRERNPQKTGGFPSRKRPATRKAFHDVIMHSKGRMIYIVLRMYSIFRLLYVFQAYNLTQLWYNISLYVYVYHFAWRRHENVSPCTGSKVNASYERIASWDGAWFPTQDLWISDTRFPAHSRGQRANHSAMTYPPKWIGTRWTVLIYVYRNVKKITDSSSKYTRAIRFQVSSPTTVLSLCGNPYHGKAAYLYSNDPSGVRWSTARTEGSLRHVILQWQRNH